MTERNFFMSQGQEVNALEMPEATKCKDCPEKVAKPKKVAPAEVKPAARSFPVIVRKEPVTRIDLKLGKIKVQIRSAQVVRVSEEAGSILLRVVQ